MTEFLFSINKLILIENKDKSKINHEWSPLHEITIVIADVFVLPSTVKFPT